MCRTGCGAPGPRTYCSNAHLSLPPPSGPAPAIAAKYRLPHANSTLPTLTNSDLPRNCSSAASTGSIDSPKCRAKAFALPIGTMPSAATGAPTSPCITSCTVPSPPQANTTSAPALAAARACIPAEPAASVWITSTEWPSPASAFTTPAVSSSRPPRPPLDAGLKISTSRTTQFYGPTDMVISF